MKLSTAQFIKKTAEKGFTLIELLVVIGILGILAAALVATIDPFEQLQKATDSRRQNMAVEFLNANIRYFTTRQAFPWDDNANAGQDCYDNLNATGISELELGDPDMLDCIGILINNGELKDAFDSNTNDLDNVFVDWDTGTTETRVCFAPVSRSVKGGVDTIYIAPDGETVDSNVCPDPDADPGDCYWCTQ